MAERTLEFQLERPKGLTFSAGQFMDITLIDPPETDAEGDTRTFSISSGPDDADLRFATRLRDTSYKRVLKSVRRGTEVRVDGPFGNLTLHDDSSRPAVLLAGGIGVTPFRSIVRGLVSEELPHRVFLFLCQPATGTRPLPG